MDDLSLERFVVEWQKAGQDWVGAKKIADQLKKNQRSYLDSLKNKLDDGSMTEAKISRLAQGSKEYSDYVDGMAAAQAKALELKVRYDGLDKLLESKRSELAMQRTQVAHGIFHIGGKP